jgi:tetratricopeptide (TPR) repeat protein
MPPPDLGTGYASARVHHVRWELGHGLAGDGAPDTMSDKSREDAYAGRPPIPDDAQVIPFQKGDYDRDVAHFTRDIANDPNNPVAYRNRGHAHYLNDDFDLSIADYTEAIRIDPANVLAYEGRALAYEDKEQWAEAISDYSLAIRCDPAATRAYTARGRLHFFRTAEYDRAIADFSEAIRLDPKPSSYFDRGRAHQKKHDLEAAISDFDKAIRLDPNKATVFSCTADAFAARGKSWTALGELDRAIADFGEAIRLGRDVFGDCGFALKAKGDHARAIAHFDRALDRPMPPADAAAIRCARGQCRLAAGAFKEAVADFAEAARLNPNDAAAQQALELARLQLRSRSWLSLFRKN